MRHLLKLAGMSEGEAREILGFAKQAKKLGERKSLPRGLCRARSGR